MWTGNVPVSAEDLFPPRSRKAGVKTRTSSATLMARSIFGPLLCLLHSHISILAVHHSGPMSQNQLKWPHTQGSIESMASDLCTSFNVRESAEVQRETMAWAAHSITVTPHFGIEIQMDHHCHLLPELCNCCKFTIRLGLQCFQGWLDYKSDQKKNAWWHSLMCLCVVLGRE